MEWRDQPAELRNLARGGCVRGARFDRRCRVGGKGARMILAGEQDGDEGQCERDGCAHGYPLASAEIG